MHGAGKYSITELKEFFSVSRPTVYRTLAFTPSWCILPRTHLRPGEAGRTCLSGSFFGAVSWPSREQQTAASLARDAMARWHSERRQFQQVDDAITDTAHYLAPDGRHYDLDDRPRYQWRTPDGHTVGTETPTPPIPGSTLLRRVPPR